MQSKTQSKNKAIDFYPHIQPGVTMMLLDGTGYDDTTVCGVLDFTRVSGDTPVVVTGRVRNLVSFVLSYGHTGMTDAQYLKVRS